MLGLPRALGSICCGIGILVAAPAAWAQPVARSFEQLQVLVKPGKTVTVTDATGIETTGRIIAISSSSVELAVAESRRTFTESDVRTISHRRAIPGKGAKWGFFVGTGIGVAAAIATAVDDDYYSDSFSKGETMLQFIAGFAGYGTVIGLGIGASMRRPRTVYAGRPIGSTVLRLSPILASGRKGASMSFSF